MIKRILITGGTSGIGYAAAVKMILKGHNLIITIKESSSIDSLISAFLKDNITILPMRHNKYQPKLV